MDLKMNGIFLDLENPEFFCTFIAQRFSETPAVVADWFTCNNKMDQERLNFAHTEYIQNVAKFSVLLHSRNPDHYKRSGCLLHALYQSDIIFESNLENGKFGPVDDLESGFTMVSHDDAQHVLKFVNFYDQYYRQIFAFNVSYQCCAAYETTPRTYDFDYLRNVCHYLNGNSNLSVESLFMLFKSLMQ
jgi:hypothetical protein